MAAVVAHEIAHLWFGDYTTFQWWNDLWFSEGMATYFEHLGLSAALPQLDPASLFFPDYGSMALDAAQLSTTRPLSPSPASPDLTNEVGVDAQFDDVAYYKGAAVANMIRMAVGATDGSFDVSHTPARTRTLVSLAGLLLANRYGSVNVTGFLGFLRTSLDEQGVVLGQGFDAWFTQAGYPVLTLALAPGSTTQLTLSQEPFLTTPGARPGCSSAPWSALLGGSSGGALAPMRWAVPVVFQEQNTTAVRIRTLGNCSDPAFYQLARPGTFVKINRGQDGLFRVAYPPDMWGKLIYAVRNNAPELSPADVAGLLDDAWYLPFANRSQPTTWISLAEGVARRGVVEYAPWRMLLEHIPAMERLMDQTAESCYNGYQNWLHNRVLAKVVLPATGVVWNASLAFRKSLEIDLLRPDILARYGLANDGPSIDRAFLLFDRQARTGAPVDPTIRPAVYQIVGRYGGLPYYQNLKSIYLNTMVGGRLPLSWGRGKRPAD